MEDLASLVEEFVARLAELGEGEPYLEQALTKAAFRDLSWSVLERLDGTSGGELADHLETVAELLREQGRDDGETA